MSDIKWIIFLNKRISNVFHNQDPKCTLPPIVLAESLYSKLCIQDPPNLDNVPFQYTFDLYPSVFLLLTFQ